MFLWPWVRISHTSFIYFFFVVVNFCKSYLCFNLCLLQSKLIFIFSIFRVIFRFFLYILCRERSIAARRCACFTHFYSTRYLTKGRFRCRLTELNHWDTKMAGESFVNSLLIRIVFLSPRKKFPYFFSSEQKYCFCGIQILMLLVLV